MRVQIRIHKAYINANENLHIDGIGKVEVGDLVILSESPALGEIEALPQFPEDKEKTEIVKAVEYIGEANNKIKAMQKYIHKPGEIFELKLKYLIQ